MKIGVQLFLGLALQCLLSTHLLGDPLAITYGDDISGTISEAGEIDTYTFDAESGDRIIIRMRGITGEVDACISLYDELGNLIADDCGDGGIVSIEDLDLKDKGQYTFTAEDRNGNDTGEYGVSIQVVNNAAYARSIACGDDFIGTFEALAQMDAYSFEAFAGEQVILQMRDYNGKIESNIRLYGPDGNLINTAEPNPSLARIDPIVLTENGTYIIVAMDIHGNDKGDYGFSYQLLGRRDCTQSINCGDDFRSELSIRAEIDAYTFDAVAGDVVVLRMRGVETAIEPRFDVYGPSGDLVISNTRFGRLGHIPATSLAETGTYTVINYESSGNDTGEYAISYEVVSNHSCATFLSCANIDEPKFISDIAEMDAYYFYGTAGEHFSAKAIAITEDIEMRLELYDPSGNQVTSAGDDKVVNRVKDVILPTSGYYTILVMDHQGNDDGEYALDIDYAPFNNCLDYCASSGVESTYEWIEGVNLDGFENVSGNNNGYGDFSQMVINVNAADNYPITLIPGFAQGKFNECWRLWVDLNKDGDFEDEGEMLLEKSSKRTIYSSINIPNYAAIGATRMRISMSFTAYADPCDVIDYGEAEDYTINIYPEVNCGALPNGWTNQDVGTPSSEGAACYKESTGTYVVESAGEDIYFTADEFQYVYKEICGDATITARVTGMNSLGEIPLAGVMMRKTLNAGSRNVSMLLTTSGTAYFQSRTSKNGETSSTSASGAVAGWVRLVREGNTFTGYFSYDGETWISIGSKTVSLSNCFYVGLATSSNELSADESTYIVTTSTFDNVEVLWDDVLVNTGDQEGVQIPNGEEETATTREEGTSARINTFTDLSVQAFPNPATDWLQVELKDWTAENLLLSIHDVQGRKLLETQGTKDDLEARRLDVSKLGAGLYTLTIDGKVNSVSKRITIIR